jgi:hypothetical protein
MQGCPYRSSGTDRLKAILVSCAVIAVAALNVSCASSRPPRSNAWANKAATLAMASVLNWHQSELIKRMGPPTSTRPDGGDGKILIWTYERKGVVVSSDRSRIAPSTTTRVGSTDETASYMAYADSSGQIHHWRVEIVDATGVHIMNDDSVRAAIQEKKRQQGR